MNIRLCFLKKKKKENLQVLNLDAQYFFGACSEYCLSIEKTVDVLHLLARIFACKCIRIARHLKREQ